MVTVTTILSKLVSIVLKGTRHLSAVLHPSRENRDEVIKVAAKGDEGLNELENLTTPPQFGASFFFFFRFIVLLVG